MDNALISHILLWGILGLTALGGLLTIGASFALGRSSYRND